MGSLVLNRDSEGTVNSLLGIEHHKLYPFVLRIMDLEQKEIEAQALPESPNLSPASSDRTPILTPSKLEAGNVQDQPVSIIRGSAMFCLGRLWNIAAEDTAVPSFLEIFPNLALTIFLFYAYYYVPRTGIADPGGFGRFIITTAVFHLVVFILNALNLWQACFNPLFKQNRTVKVLVIARICMFVGEIVSLIPLVLKFLFSLSGGGVHWIVYSLETCSD
jgi:hypothetical protein